MNKIFLFILLLFNISCSNGIFDFYSETKPFEIINYRWEEKTILRASNAESGDYFGYTVAISGETIAVGAYGEASNATTIDNDDGSPTATVNGFSYAGAVYVYKKNTSGNWVQDAYLKPTNMDTSDHFAINLAISNDIIVVGAYQEDNSLTTINNTDNCSITQTDTASSSGAVYVFKKDGSGNWIQDAYLKASNAASQDYFGSAVAISGDTIVVGAYGEDSSSTSIDNDDGDPTTDTNGLTDPGAAYVYKKDGSGNWIQDAYLKAPNAGTGDYFGHTVAISGDTIVVGARGEDNSSTSINNSDSATITDAGTLTDSGAVYVFKKDGSGNWVRDAYLKASNTGVNDYFSGGEGAFNFAAGVAISNDTIVVGAYGQDNSSTSIINTDDASITDAGTATDSGAVYVFKKKSNGDWFQDAYLKASNAGASDLFGYSVAISGDYIVVGAYSEDNSSTSINNTDNASINETSTALQSGAAYVFKKNTNGDWVQDAYLKASDAAASDLYGFSVAISGNIIVVGAYENATGGAAYIIQGVKE